MGLESSKSDVDDFTVSAEYGPEISSTCCYHCIGVSGDVCSRDSHQVVVECTSARVESVLLSECVDAQQVDSEISNLLFTFVYYGKKKSLQNLLQENKEMSFASVTWIKGLNALHVASMRGHICCVKLLCTLCKFDIDQLDEVDRTALTWSARNKHFAVYDYLKSKTILSRLPDVYGLMACQYLYDNSIEDRGPDVIAFERFFELSASTKWDNMHEDDRLSLHTVSLCTSPATSSCKSTPHVESRRTITSPLTIDSGARSHSPNNSISSLDVTISMSPQHSPIQGREWPVQSLCPDSYLFRAAATAVLSRKDSKHEFLNNIACRRRTTGSLTKLVLREVVTTDSGDDCSQDGMSDILAVDENVSPNSFQVVDHVTHKQSASWHQGLKQLLTKKLLSPVSTTGSMRVQASLCEKLLE